MSNDDERDFAEERWVKEHLLHPEGDEDVAPTVTLTVTDLFFEEARPWHEDALAAGHEITEARSGKRWTLTLDAETAADLLSFAWYGVDRMRYSGWGRDPYCLRLSRSYNAATRSLRKQLIALNVPFDRRYLREP